MDFQLTNNSVRGDNIGTLTTTRRVNRSATFKVAADDKKYPTKIHYGNMKNDTLAEKERLLKKWTFS